MKKSRFAETQIVGILKEADFDVAGFQIPLEPSFSTGELISWRAE